MIGTAGSTTRHRDHRPLLVNGAVRLGLAARDRWDAIDQVGRTFREIGATNDKYSADMRKRELRASTYIGENVAVPHGPYEENHHIHHPALVVLQFPDGVEWDGAEVNLCIGIAATGDEQIGLLCGLGQILIEGSSAAELREASDLENVMRLMRPVSC